MVQPYLAEVERVGEAALIYIDGAFSHAVTKAALLDRGQVNPVEPAHPLALRPRKDHAAAGHRGRAGAGRSGHGLRRASGSGALLYARVDLLPRRPGPVMIELELTEPSLFLGTIRASADRLAARHRATGSTG